MSAIDMYGDCIERAPERAEAYYKRANVLNGLGRLECRARGLRSRDTVSILPTHYALCNRGSVLERLERLRRGACKLRSRDRVGSERCSDALQPRLGAQGAQDVRRGACELRYGHRSQRRFCRGYVNRGSVLKDLERYEEALVSYETALGLNSNFAEAHLNRGHVLQELRRHEAAIESFERAIALRANCREAYYGRGVSLHVRKRWIKRGATSTRQLRSSRVLPLRTIVGVIYWRTSVVTTRPPSITSRQPSWRRMLRVTWVWRRAPFACKRFDLAIASLDKAMLLEPDGQYLLGMPPCDQDASGRWDGLDEDLGRIARGVSEGKRVCTPMMLAALMDSPALQRSAAEMFGSGPGSMVRAGRGSGESESPQNLLHIFAVPDRRRFE